MLRVRLECKKVRSERIAYLFDRLRKTSPVEFKVWVYNGKTYAVLNISSISLLREVKRRLERMEIDFRFTLIEKVVFDGKQRH